MIRFLEIFTEVLAWLGIVISFTFLGGITGGLTYLIVKGTAGIIGGLILTITGIITGFYLAVKAWRTTGTVHFISGLARDRW